MAAPSAGPPAPVTFGPPDDPRKWVQIANIIAARLADGTYPPGEWLPRETQMVAHFMVSNLPVRQALTRLQGKGLVTQVEGRGWYAGCGNVPATPRAKTSTAQHLGQTPQAATGEPAAPPGSQRAALLATEFVTVRELATLLRLSVMTIYRAIHEGKIKGVLQVERSIRIPVEAAHAYMHSCTIDGQQLDPEQDELE